METGIFIFGMVFGVGIYVSIGRLTDCIAKACSLQAERNETYRLKILFEKKRHETLKG